MYAIDLNLVPSFRSILASTLGVLVLANAFAQSQLGEARLERTLERPRARFQTTTTAAEEKPKWKFGYSIGLAYTQLDIGDHGLNTPFMISASYTKSEFILQGDGYGEVHDGGKVSGFADPALIARFKISDPRDTENSWKAGFSTTIPVKGDLGSVRTKERVLLSYTKKVNDKWVAALTGNLTRDENARKSHSNPYGQSAIGQAVYLLENDKDVFFQAIASHRNGRRWYQTVVCGVDFPLARGVTGTVALAQGLSRDARDTTIEFDVSW